eukprot:3355833-Pyramimonas_sp.AAC.1
MVVTNPPWGLRIGNGNDEEEWDEGEGEGARRDASVDANVDTSLDAAWSSLGRFLKAKCGGAEVWAPCRPLVDPL